jgi:GDP-4-dehydro-6-deoxy-D-mannose reductase
VARRIVVTGAQGLLGRNLVRTLLVSDRELTVMGLGRSGRLTVDFTHQLGWLDESVAAPLTPALLEAEEDPRYSYRSIDLTDGTALARVLAECAPDVVVHAAAALRDEPLDALLRSNIAASATLLESLPAGSTTPRVVMVSSGSVYGIVPADRLPIDEGEARRPLDLYAASKSATEDVSQIIARERGIPTVVARVFNLLGPGLQDRHLAAELAAQVAAIKLGVQAPVLHVGPLDTTRDFVDVRDAAQGLARLACDDRGEGTYNVASGRETPTRSILDGLLAAAELGAADVSIVRRERRSGDYERSYADIGRIRALGFQPERPLAQSLADMLDYYVGFVSRRSRRRRRNPR